MKILIRTIPLFIASLFILTIVGANWALATYGIIPIAPGITAPAGVLFAGLAFSLRDFLHDTGGRWWVIGVIAVGGAASWQLEGAQQFAVASAAAFTVSEVLDFAIYAPLRKRGWLRAVALSNIGGLALDSLVFLWLAFGSLQFLEGQLIGKGYMTLLAVVLLWGWRKRRNA